MFRTKINTQLKKKKKRLLLNEKDNINYFDWLVDICIRNVIGGGLRKAKGFLEYGKRAKPQLQNLVDLTNAWRWPRGTPPFVLKTPSTSLFLLLLHFLQCAIKRPVQSSLFLYLQPARFQNGHTLFTQLIHEMCPLEAKGAFY